MANYNFKKDLVVGNDGEDVVIKDLETLGAKLLSKNDDNKYDVKMKCDGEEILYEIKTDVFCKPNRDTNNLFVEFECRGKPSGIMVTEAKWFVTYFKYLNEIWYIKTDTLKYLIKNNDWKQTEFSGDNNSNTKGWLMPRFQYLKYFKRNNVTK